MQLNCSLCGKPYEFNYEPGKALGYFPFCSKRCKLIDLGKWLGGEYQLSVDLPELDGLDEGERHQMVQYLLDAGLVDAVNEEDDSDTDSKDSD